MTTQTAIRGQSLFSPIFETEQDCQDNPFLFTDTHGLREVKPLRESYEEVKMLGHLLILVDADGNELTSPQD